MTTTAMLTATAAVAMRTIIFLDDVSRCAICRINEFILL